MRTASHQHTIRFQSLASNGRNHNHAKQPAKPLRFTVAVLLARYSWLCNVAREAAWSDTTGYAIASVRADLASRYVTRAAVRVFARGAGKVSL